MTALGSFVTISLKSGVDSLMLVTRMSSEVCQLCLEAVTPLAEQCAKAQETDSALFLATRHFLKVRTTVSCYFVGFLLLCCSCFFFFGGGGGFFFLHTSSFKRPNSDTIRLH